MNKAYLLTGGNLGNREINLSRAAELIGTQCGMVVASSAIYQTDAWGIEDQPAFLNQALEVDTNLEPDELLKAVLSIEAQIGRVRDIRYGPRLIDIDILLFNNEVQDLPTLIIPHPQLPNRRFALTPLAEIAPLYVHPVLRRTITELLVETPDTLTVTRYMGTGLL